MFTGIIEATGIVENVTEIGKNRDFWLSAPFVEELKIDQSLAHNGCCLTVVEKKDDLYLVQAIDETLQKTNVGSWKKGDVINLERCMQMNGRLDGHIVQGHVDEKGQVHAIENRDGSFYITITYSDASSFITVPQGSITINGISLTVANSADHQFSVAIIPYTWEFTNMKTLKAGDEVNLEFDIIGKYVAKLLAKQYN